jgi:DNA-binding NtrC family response regulator
MGPKTSFWDSLAPEARHALELARLYAGLNRTVVIVGAVGVGKTFLAREIHRASARVGELVEVSAGELTESLFADTLFGHVAGAFTGASSMRRGAIAEAADGSLLLDDLAIMPRVVQSAVLRVIESRRYRPLGGKRDKAATCRLVLASTEDPRTLAEKGDLLPDLASRLGEFVVRLPPLRARRADIVALARRAGEEMLREHGFRGDLALSDEVRVLLEAYRWPYNVRELKSVMERAVVHAGMSHESVVIRPVHLPERVRNSLSASDPKTSLTVELVESVLRRVGGNQSEAARRLGVHRNTIARYVRNAG